ncbi:energy transducer TonB [Psychroflexus aestuariivivens]|uniref:energy transducer TonB n=1 Tax=Psychroflexus aestuariivivens TaxID=1795040 RepID=UPI000FD94DF8|nr:energy transducer TonB [Psychroflexus aestuariivivens]
MKPKKYDHKNLNKKKVFFFQIGLIAVLSLVLISVEWKTEARTMTDHDQVDYQILKTEEIPIVKLPEKKVKPISKPQPKIDDFEIVDDKIETDPDSKLEDTEPEPLESTGIIDFKDLEKTEDEPITEMSFELIEDVPIFPGCENLSNNDERKACMNKQIQKFINKEFDTRLASDLGLEGKNRIYTTFKINHKGEVEFLNARASHPKLKEESQRVIEKLPKMQPGKQRGKAVGVIFAIPISFNISD